MTASTALSEQIAWGFRTDRLPVEDLLTSWERSLRARNLTDRTIATYLDSASQLAEHAHAHGLDPLSRTAIEHYLAHVAAHRLREERRVERELAAGRERLMKERARLLNALTSTVGSGFGDVLGLRRKDPLTRKNAGC